jgi:hypothetical protein
VGTVQPCRVTAPAGGVPCDIDATPTPTAHSGSASVPRLPQLAENDHSPGMAVPRRTGWRMPANVSLAAWVPTLTIRRRV